MPGKKKQVEELEGDDTSENLEAESVDITDSDFKADKTGVTQIGDLDIDEDEDEDDNDDDDEKKSKGPVSIVDKLKALLAKKPAKISAAAPGKAGAKKSIISKPIAAILFIGIVAYLYGDQLFPTEPDIPAVDPQTAKIEATRKQRAADKKAAAAAAAAVGTGTDVVVTDPTTTPTEPIIEPTIPGETPTTDTTTETPPADMTTTVPDLTPTEPTESVTTDLPVTEPEITEPTTDNPPVDTATTDVIDSDTSTSTSDENMTDKILEDLEKQVKQATPRAAVMTYVSPPDYEYRGRGLVYNCVGKHWACIDGPSYRVCEDNASGTKHLKRSHECYPFNVYQTQSGCEKTQNRMVSSGAKTNFCKE